MARGQMYIGTRQRMGWVPAPNVSNIDASTVGWHSSTQFLNGGVAMRRSKTSHKHYSFTWNLMSRDQAQALTDIYDGIDGDGPVFFLDPMEMDRNLAPAHWASPFMGGYDAPVLVGTAKPTLSATGANGYGYPVQSATYGTGDKRKLWVPIPQGYTLWAGWSASSSTGSMMAAPALTATNVQTPVAMTRLDVTDPTRVNTSWDGNTYVGVEFSYGDNTTVAGFMVQCLPTGATPAPGTFISGQGNSGCEFVGNPVRTPYSAVLDKIGLKVELEEYYDWL